MKTILRVVVSLLAFAVASGVTYVIIRKWSPAKQVKSGSYQKDTLEGVNGLSEGEVVTLPALTTLSGETVDLGDMKQERLLCVFIGSRCPGCITDIDLWKDLNQESGKQGVAFYVVDIGDDRPQLEQFSSAYKLDDLPLLFDPNNKVGPRLKVGFLPQYVLFTNKGQVLHRWDGVRRYDKRAGLNQLAEFFQSH